MNEKILSLAQEFKAAITGTPSKPIDPTIAAANVICEIALPRVKTEKPNQFATAKKLYAENKKLQKAINTDLTEPAAFAAYDRQSADHQREAVEGNLAGVPRGRSRQAWIEDFAARRDAANEAIIKNGAKLAPLQTEISDVILATLHNEIAELENVEARQAARFGIPFAASPTVAKLRSLADYLRNRGAITLLENA